jgi:PAS domain S-box-containing protein
MDARMLSACRGEAGRPAHKGRQLSEGSRAMNKQGKMNQWLWDMFSAGLPMDYDLEALRKIFLINLIAFVGGLVLFAFSILEFIIQDYYLFFVDMLFFFVLAGLFIYLRKTKNYHVVSLIGTTLTGFFYFFFIAYGGFGNTAFLWAFTYPLIAIFLLGTRKGSVFSLLFLFMACSVFVLASQIPFFTSYDVYIKMRFIPAYLTVYLLAFIMEKTRNIVSNRLDAAKSEVAETVRKLESINRKITLSEKRLRQIIDLVPHFIFAKDQDGRFILVNQALAEAYGTTVEKLVGKCDADFSATEEEVGNFRKDDIEVIRSGVPKVIKEERITDADGKKRILSTQKIPFTFSGATLPAVLGVSMDITELKQAEEEREKLQDQLQRSQKMESIGLLAGGVAHDLNNILSGIVSYPELLLLNLPEDSHLRKPLKTMMAAGLRATAIVQDLLTMARGAATANELLNINDLTRECLRSPEMERLKQQHPFMTIKTGLDPRPLRIGGSSTHVRKVIMNLVFNAAEAIEENGTIVISTGNQQIDQPLKVYGGTIKGDYAVLSVSDDGSGILPEDLERIFEPFYAKKRMGRSGTGLGLAVVWNVVQDHKGYIHVTTRRNGTTFALYFPVVSDSVSNEDLSPSVEDYQGNGETILVVDDEEYQREISCKILAALGYEAISASSGEEAVEYLKNNTVDLVLLDMIMDPGISGHETYRRIIEIHSEQKAIIVSGFSEKDDVRGIQSIGAGKYIKKPLTIKRMGLAVKEELEKRNSRADDDG